ncbi:snoRNA-binding rRNA-processing protein UTP10 [Sporobolomyces salmoneus]|uniref:snoRNA-binding rRNA-processing protein UTP10 n=1 Tax=Sporobolomyces salmoneus TaxID=183962 RepID=UPI00317D3B38
MASSLAKQLAARNTLDSARLATQRSIKNPPSFIFTPRHAATVSTADLHSLAVNAWEQLAAVDSWFEDHFKDILGEQAKGLDRTGLTKEENEKLGAMLDKTLRHLGKHMLLKPAGVVLEWLVRRFRVQDLNIPALVALFLPYHSTPHFPSALNLISEASLAATPYAPLVIARKSLQPVALPDLIALLPPTSTSTTARPFLDCLLHLPLDYLTQNEKPHRALLGFWLQVVAGYLDQVGPRLPDGERAAVLSTVLEVLRSARAVPDALIASYILVARFAMHHPFDAETLRVVLKGVVTNRAKRDVADDETDAALVTTLVVIAQLGEEELSVSDGKKFLGGNGWKNLLKTEKLDELVVQLSNQYDATKFMRPFLQTLAEEALTSEECLAILSSVLVPRPSPELGSDAILSLPDPTISHLVWSCFTAITNSEDSIAPTVLQKPLSLVYQRYPSIWSAQTKEFSTKLQATNSEALPRLLQAMNAVLGGSTLSTDASTALVISSASPDVAIRVSALKDVLKNAEDIKANGNGSFLRETLLARLSEPDQEVAAVVLAQGNRSILEETLEAQELLQAVETPIKTGDAAYLKTVLPFLTGSFVSSHSHLADQIVKTILWPRLLSTKADSKINAVIFAALEGSILEKTHPWLKNVGSAQASEGVEQNSKVVDTIARNLAALPSQQLDEAIAFLLLEVAQPEPSWLSLLVSIAFAGKVEKARRVEFASSVLAAFRVDQGGLDILSGAQADKLFDEATGFIDASLLQNIFVHPTVAKTSRQLCAATVVGVIQAVHPVQHASWNWLSTTLDAKDQQVVAYRTLCTLIYRIAHTNSSTPGSAALATSLLSTLFTSLVADDVLAFLASLFTSSEVAIELRLSALKDSAVFIDVLSSASEKKAIDWQVVVPSVISALGDGEKKIRVEGLKVLEKIRDVAVAKEGTKTGSVYGRDKFYGSSTSSLKYLELPDLLIYLTKLLASRNEITLSPSHLSVLHASMLDSSDTPSKKKKVSLSFKVSTFLLGHVAAWKSLSARRKLLLALEGVKEKEKTNVVVQLVEESISLGEAGRAAFVATAPDEEVQTYAKLLLQPYDGITRKSLESEDSSAFAVLLQSFEITDTQGLGAHIRREALRLTGTSVFSVLKGENRVELFKRLVKLAVNSDARVASDVLACIRLAKADADTVTAFLQDVRTSFAGPTQGVKGAKRGRTSVGGAASSNTVPRTERLPELVVVLESVEFSNLVASHGLLLGLFELLACLVEVPTANQVEVQYPGQLLLGALGRVVENVEPTSGVTSDSIRMAPVLDFMRSSVNPQTYHQSLLLLAQLGPLVPDQLVQNIMPIFTFMGANVLQRDDAYSLRVVDQTLEKIIPPLVKALEKTARGRAGLIVDLRELLRAFTDAAVHVPRHRRINLFVRFVETLGAQDFLSPVTMLLVERAGKTLDETALPVALLENFDIHVQLGTIKQIVEELSRLVNLEPSFLNLEAEVPSGPKAKDLSITLLTFIGYALEAKQLTSKIDSARSAGDEEVDSTLTELVRGLLDLSSLVSPSIPASDREEISAAANYDVNDTISLMSTKSFSDAILWLLDLADPSIQPRAFALLRARLPNVKATRRIEISQAVTTVVERIQTVIKSSDSDIVAVDEALQTLSAISDSVLAEEDALLAKTVPDLIDVAKDSNCPKSTRSASVAILTKLSNRLGPRLIPLVAKIVPFALDLLHAQAKAGTEAVTDLVVGAFETLEGLFTSVPVFIGGQLDKVFSASLSSDIMALSSGKTGAVPKARAALLSTAARKLPAKTLYPAIIRLHASLDGNARAPILGLLDLLTRALRHGKTPDIVENYRIVFKLFLSVFDLRRVHSPSLDENDITSIEENALGAFVQFILKLNEQLFRPLFLRTYDWAVIELADEPDAEKGITARRVVLYKIVDRLLAQLRSIFVPYFSFMLDQTTELLEAFAKGESNDSTLWSAVASALTKAFDHDENGFWSAQRLAKLSSPLAHQIEAPSGLFPISTYHSLLSSYVDLLASHETHLKSFNSQFLHLTRSDDLLVKRQAIEAIDRLWETVGDGMLGLVPETTPFLAEAREETEGGVETATRALIKRIEEHLGESLDEYLEQ